MNNCEKSKFWPIETFPQDFNPDFKNRIKIPREIFPVGETKYAVLDLNVTISCSVDKEVRNYIPKKYEMMFLGEMKIQWDFTP